MTAQSGGLTCSLCTKPRPLSADAGACLPLQGTSPSARVAGESGGEPSCSIPKSLFQEGEESLGKCSARVFFRNRKPRPAVNVTCARLMEKTKRQQEDYRLYKQMKQLRNPLDGVSIPGMNSCPEFLPSGMYVITTS